MPTRSRKRKASEEEEPEVGEISQPVKKPARKPRATKPLPSQNGGTSKRAKGGANNLTTGIASKTSKSTSSSARSVKNDIQRKAEDLIHLIDDQYKGSRSSGARGSLQNSRITAILQDGPTTQNMVYQKLCERLKMVKETIDEYEAINRGSINISKPTQSAHWEQDSQDIVKVEKRAMEILIQTLNGLILSGDHTNLLRSSPRSTDDIEQAAWRWVEDGIPAAEATWGSSAREALRAFAGVTKLLS